MPDANARLAARPERNVPRQASPSRHIESPVELTDEFVQLVADRVVERLNDRLVRSTATEVISRLAKWLVADEIERTGKRKK